MNRLQKKCILASAGLHLLLVSVLFIGPAFLPEPEKPADLPVLDFIPTKTVDALISGGGNPNAQPPPAAAPAPAPEPKKPVVEPKPEPKPDPKPEPKPEPKPQPKPTPPEPKPQPNPKTEPDPDSLEVTEKPRKKPQVNLEPVVRNDPSKAQAKAKAAREAAERREREEQAEARRRLAATIGRMANNLSSGLSSSTTIELKGPGGGGVPYANFLQAVKSVYARAWILPDGVTDDDATAVATVTIARDGSVVTHRIVKPSGNAAVDRSVRAALERVRFAAPLPDDAKEDERTVSINFNVRAKRALG